MTKKINNKKLFIKIMECIEIDKKISIIEFFEQLCENEYDYVLLEKIKKYFTNFTMDDFLYVNFFEISKEVEARDRYAMNVFINKFIFIIEHGNPYTL